MAETMERRMDARITEAEASYRHLPAYTLDRSDLREVLDTLVDLHRQIATQSDLNGLVYWLRQATTFCIRSAAGLSREGVADVAATVRKQAHGWIGLAGMYQRGNPTKVLARGLRSIFEMEVGNVARRSIQAYRWQGNYAEQATRNLISLAAALLPASIYFEAIRDGVRPAFRGDGEQLTLF